MAYLTKEKYIDEKRYIRCFALDKIRYNKWGRRKVEQALWMKHISKSDMKEVLDEIAPDEYMQVLTPLLKAKMKGIKGRNDYERKMKLTRFALGRGFSYEQIREASGWETDLEAEELEDAEP
ncbi:MAG: RecX family transcriptional regulator [Prevotella sp.]|nr:RecX family transcriptional regulator [Prevotella sp.]